MAAGGFKPPGGTDGQKVQHARADLWWPAADPATLRAAAGHWRDLANEVETVARQATGTVVRVCDENQSRGLIAFDAYWSSRWTGGAGCLPAVVEASRELAQALDGYAHSVEKAQERIKELVAAAATAVVVGVGLTILTVGISDIAAGALATSLVAAAAAVGLQLSTEAATIVAGVLLVTAAGALEGGLANLAIQAERVGCFHDQAAIDWQEVVHSAEAGALTGAATAGLGAGAAAAAPAVGRIGVRLGATQVIGLRRPAQYRLSARDMERLRMEFREIGGDPARLRFNRGPCTAYSDSSDLIYVRGDVLPSTDRNVVHPRSLMSSRAALAHELGHANFRGTGLSPGSWNDEFRASYWAARNVAGLSFEDRRRLVQDALTRVEEAGRTIHKNRFIMKTLNGIPVPR
jgi:hypothetical protein